MTPQQVYKATEYTDRVTRPTADAPGGRVGGGPDELGAPPPSLAPPAVQSLADLPTPPNGPRPVLEPAQVMRVWISPWTDQSGNLNWPGYVYTEVTPRRWSFGEDSVGRAPALVPLQTIAPHKLAKATTQSTEPPLDLASADQKKVAPESRPGGPPSPQASRPPARPAPPAGSTPPSGGVGDGTLGNPSLQGDSL